MSSVPPAYFQWVQFDEFCSCGLRKAVFQRNFETYLTEFLESGLSLSDARIQTIKKIGQLKLCCLRDFTNPAANFINDSTSNALVDITTNKETAIQKNVRTGNNSGVIGWEFLPTTNNVVGFDMNSYCQKLSHISQSSYDKIGLNKNSSHNSDKLPAQFSNFSVTRSQDYPINKPVTPFPTDNELLQYLNN